MSPEEKLLKAIFGEKAGDVRDTSLTVPPGIEGIVVGYACFHAVEPRRIPDARAIEEEEMAASRERFLRRDQDC